MLRRAEKGPAIGEVCRKANISETAIYNCRKKYGGLMPSEMRRLKQLEEENEKLRKLVADPLARSLSTYRTRSSAATSMPLRCRRRRVSSLTARGDAR